MAVSPRLRRCALVTATVVMCVGTNAAAPNAAAAARCSYVVHIGDSTTYGMARWLPGAYRANGFTALVDGSNGRGIRFGGTNGTRVAGMVAAQQLRRRVPAAAGAPCWVFALGTNDGAWAPNDAYRVASIRMMMTLAKGDPVMWVNVWTFGPAKGAHPMSPAVATHWNALLAGTLAGYPNAKVFDWASVAQLHPEWFISDHVHYTQVGYTNRAVLVAQAAATAFG
jgi:lysophospholipase L1-like esterase